MFQNYSVQMTELTEDELTAVTGNGGFDGGFGGCGTCGGGLGFGFVPFVTAFTNFNATTFAAQTSVQFSHVNQTSFFTQFG